MFGRWLNKARPADEPSPALPTVNGGASPPGPIVELRQVVKTYQTAAGEFTALKGVSLRVNAGEFVAVIGKSGSGKSTLINVITGIDRPTSGEVMVAGTPVHTLSEGQMAPWRGRHLGVIFQFFQLLPTLSLVENVMLPMDFCGMYAPGERRERALQLLEVVDMAEQADKLPSAVSGGQQQRAAIARALANDPPILVADEPTGSLDSRTADTIFELFEDLVGRGKTILMVTHDNDLAQRATRTVIVADGEVINQYVTRALSTLDPEQLTHAASRLETSTYPSGAVVIRQGDEADKFYIITQGQAEVVVEHPGGQEIVVNRLVAGQYFGEIAVLRGGRRTATVRAAVDNPSGLEVMALDKETFRDLARVSQVTRESIDRAIQERLTQLTAAAEPVRHGR